MLWLCWRSAEYCKSGDNILIIWLWRWNRWKISAIAKTTSFGCEVLYSNSGVKPNRKYLVFQSSVWWCPWWGWKILTMTITTRVGFEVLDSYNDVQFSGGLSILRERWRQQWLYLRETGLKYCSAILMCNLIENNMLLASSFAIQFKAKYSYGTADRRMLSMV